MTTRSSKASKIRATARKRITDTPKQLELETKRSDKREILLSAEAKAMLEDMRSQGFCPPRGIPTVKQYSRYAAFKNSQAATARAQVIADDAATISARGGIAELVYERLTNPKLKDTAFAQLATLLQRSLALAPALVDESQRVSLSTDQSIIDDADLGDIAKELGVDL
ncbi:hypothetical protein [Buttiauxella brennerae]|uniref:hypothetical protein n=1 Tax=Buttiauxella brennerae TaxID=82988 RepID=UPI00286F748C|nr:hypothetical protein [Buttiauxella brennerae]